MNCTSLHQGFKTVVLVSPMESFRVACNEIKCRKIFSAGCCSRYIINMIISWSVIKKIIIMAFL